MLKTKTLSLCAFSLPRSLSHSLERFNLKMYNSCLAALPTVLQFEQRKSIRFRLRYNFKTDIKSFDLLRAFEIWRKRARRHR